MTPRVHMIFLLLGPLMLFSCSSSSDQGAVTYQTYTVTQKNLVRSIDANGSVETDKNIYVNSPMGGRLDEVYVEIGQKIKKGQRIAKVSSDRRVQVLEMASEQGPEEVAYWEGQILPIYVSSPLSGKVIAVHFRAGEQLKGAIISLSEKEIVKVNIDEVDVPRLKKGHPALIHFEVLGDKPVEGFVRELAETSRKINNVNVYEAIIAFDRDLAAKQLGFEPRIGMSVTVEFPLMTLKDVLALPAQAVNSESNTQVTLRSRGQEVSVRLGEIIGDDVHVLEGLAKGDTVEVALPKAAGRPQKSLLDWVKK